jgi:hypothetical protein
MGGLVMYPKTDKNKRRDSKKRYKGYPYANKQYMRTVVARKARRLGILDNTTYKKLGSYTVQDIW